MSGHWPPEWEDPEEEFTEGAEDGTPVVDETAEARLSEVTAYLASVPVPAMPDAVERRINAALAAEVNGSRPLGPPPARARIRRRGPERKRSGGDRPRRGFPGRDFLHGQGRGIGLVVVCLLLAGLGFALSRGAPQSESSSAAEPAAGSNITQGSSSSGSSAASAAGAVPRPSAPLGPQEGSVSGVSFAVTASGTRYQRSTLTEQVRDRLVANGRSRTPVPSAAATPSAALRGCVVKLTGGAEPRLVDRATYQGEPAYVIASSARVWVVGPGCTAAKTELIVSVALAGLPGNLHALVSVEQ
jgi:hypothetical protein